MNIARSGYVCLQNYNMNMSLNGVQAWESVAKATKPVHYTAD